MCRVNTGPMLEHAVSRRGCPKRSREWAPLERRLLRLLFLASSVKSVVSVSGLRLSQIYIEWKFWLTVAWRGRLP